MKLSIKNIVPSLCGFSLSYHNNQSGPNKTSLGKTHEKCITEIQRKSFNISSHIHNKTLKIYNTQVWHRTTRPVKVATNYWMRVFLVKLSIPILGSVLRNAQLHVHFSLNERTGWKQQYCAKTMDGQANKVEQCAKLHNIYI